MEKEQKIAQIDRGSMKRSLKVGDLFAIGYGDLGSSIYYALGITALFALGAAPLSLLLAGIVFVCTALSYAELTSMLKDSSGSATFVRHAFNDLISFVAGWGLLLDFIVTIAISSYSIGPYLAFFFDALKSPSNKVILTVILISLLFTLNYFGTKHSTRVSWCLTTLTLATQLATIVIGSIWLLKMPQLFEHVKIGIKGSSWSPTWPNFWKGTAMAMVAYTGIESMAQLSSESRDPSRTVPRAILIAMGALLFVHIGLAAVALSALSPKELSTTYLENPLAGIVSALPFGGRAIGGWVGLLAAVILFVAANAGLLGASRLSYHLGENYQIPRFVYKLHPRHKTPFIGLATFSILAIAIVVSSRGRIAFLADLYNFGAMLAFFMTHLSLILLRIKHPDAKRPFKVACNIQIGRAAIPISSILGGIVTLGTWCLIVATKPEGRYLGIFWIAIGLLIYFSYRKKHRIAPMGKVAIQKIRIPEFAISHYRNILVPTRGGKETETVQMACEIAKVHGGRVTAIHVVEVPFSLPLEIPLPHRTAIAEAILERAEAIGREFSISMHLRITHSRSVDTAVIEMAERDRCDLIVMGMTRTREGISKERGAIIDRIVSKAPCPVWICCNTPPLLRKSPTPHEERGSTQ